MSLAGSIQIGDIVDVSAANNVYRIRIPGLPNPIAAYGGSSQASYAPGSSQSRQAYSVGTKVMCFLPPQWPNSHAIVLSAVPQPYPYQDRLNFPSTEHWEWPPYEDYYEGSQYIEGTEEYTIPGQEGFAFPTGTNLTIDQFRAIFGATDRAQIEANIIDHMLRITGYNLEILTPGSLEKKIVEQGEWDEIRLMTPYLWEAKMRALDRVAEEISVGGRVYEPEDEIVVPRHVILRGYMGDLEREVIQAPNLYEDWNASTITNVDQGIGLLEINKGVDGSYRLSSAKEVLIEKTSVFAPLKLVKHEAEYKYDPDNLTEANYYPAGIRFSDFGDMFSYYSLPMNHADPTEYDDRYYYTTKNIAVDAIPATGFVYTDITDYGGAGFAGILAEGEADSRDTEHKTTLDKHPGWDRPNSVPTISPGGVERKGWYQIDHRSYVSYQDTSSRIYMMEDGSIVLQAGTGSTASKIVLHPTTGIHIVGPHVTTMASASDGEISIGGDKLRLTGYDTQIASEDYTQIWSGDETVVQNLAVGELAAQRSQAPTTVDIKIYSSDGTGVWTEETTVEQTGVTASDGFKTIDVSGITTENKVFKAVVEWQVETDENGNNITERLESNVFSLGGGGDLRLETTPIQIETRTDDPTGPDNGRIWLRTDL